MEMMDFSVDTHTFWLNMGFGLLGLVLTGIWLRGRPAAA